MERMLFVVFSFAVKFIHSEKATKFCEISTLLLSARTEHKSKVDTSQNFVDILRIYSHLFNKRGAHAIPILKNSTLHKTKIHPPRLLNSQIFPPSTPRLLELCTSFFQKIPPSTFIPTSTFRDSATFEPPPRLFQPPRLLKMRVQTLTTQTGSIAVLLKYRRVNPKSDRIIN